MITNPTTMSDAGKRKLKNAESFRNHAYIDANGKWTIGFGHRILPSEMRTYVQLNTPVTVEEGNAIFEKDLATKCGAVNDALNGTHVSINQNQYDALVMFIYNIGVGAWLGSTARRDLRTVHISLIPAEMRRWVHDDHGKVIHGLENRRETEIALFNSPVHV